jgi:hypothetical protein
MFLGIEVEPGSGHLLQTTLLMGHNVILEICQVRLLTSSPF